MRRRLTALVAIALVATATGCGEKQEELKPGTTVPFELMLDFFPNADHAGIYAAKAAGLFRQAGLDLKIRTPSDPAAPIRQVAAGRVDLAISYEPELLRARDQGLRVVAVAALVRTPLTTIISLPRAGISKPSDLAGKTVGTAGIDYQSAYLETILRKAGVPRSRVKERNVGFDLVPALATGKVDAILGGYWNYEGEQLRLAHRRPRIIKLDQAGVPSYDELVLVASQDALERRGDAIRAFIGALARGTHLLDRDPAEGIQGLLRANRELDPRLQRASVKVTLPYLLPPRGKPFGYMDPERWRAFAAWMHAGGILRDAASAEGALTDDYLPGKGPS
ncbi:MAG: ABC transporter substrate-binding protein [Thermoleophilaceae bacterium]|nr:ABC transporter substrate-binding protein [Thermoleophilaceae bacterium]